VIAPPCSLCRRGTAANSTSSGRSALVLLSIRRFDFTDRFIRRGTSTWWSAKHSSLATLIHPRWPRPRFVLLPVQADRSLSSLQLRGLQGKKRNRKSSGIAGGSVMSSGLGFFSSMLKRSRFGCLICRSIRCNPFGFRSNLKDFQLILGIPVLHTYILVH
jgi:hypothetical protein